jgi:hypothetical protein
MLTCFSVFANAARPDPPIWAGFRAFPKSMGKNMPKSWI